jgi:hypothetical protein
MNQKLQNKIEKKLDQLQDLLSNITEASIIDPNDPDT